MIFDLFQVLVLGVWIFVSAAISMCGAYHRPVLARENLPLLLGGAAAWIVTASIPFSMAYAEGKGMLEATVMVCAPTVLATLFLLVFRRLYPSST